MRWLVVCACCALAAAAVPGSADARPRALIAYLPTTELPLLDELAGRGLSYGLMSPTLGGYSPQQLALDVGQGSRISTRAYDDDPPALRLVTGPPRIAGWRSAVERAEDAPGEAVPGLLASTAGRVTYAGVAGFDQVEAISAADRDGRLDESALTVPRGFTGRALELWHRSDLLVARLPAEHAGLRSLDRLLAARGSEDLVVVMRAPPQGELQLLPAGVAGPGFEGGRLTSRTTRLDGFVTATDVAPTVLDHLGLDVPDRMNGRVLEDRPGGSPADLRERAERFDVVVGRRMPMVRAGLAALVGLLAALVALGRGAGLRAWLRLTLLAGLWLPGVALVTAALRPSRGAEIAILVLGALALAAATDRLLPWPRGPALPAVCVFLAHAVDLAAGSELIDASLAGPNPKGGARFYGVGNELETILVLTVLLGAGAAVARRRDALPPRVLAGACLVGGVVIGAGRLGADVGGVVTLGAGGAAAVGAALLYQRGHLGRRALAMAVAAPALAIGLLILVDVVTGGGAHLTRSVIEADEPGDLFDIVERRFRISFGGVASGTAPVSVGIAVLLLAAGAVWRERVLRPLAAAPALRAAVVGAWFATVTGALANDSGPLILLIGTAGLLLAVAYAHGGPAITAPSSTMTRCA